MCVVFNSVQLQRTAVNQIMVYIQDFTTRLCTSVSEPLNRVIEMISIKPNDMFGLD